ncbi:MAG: VanW family protein [Pseudomonadales bacterium]|nr:VanW family protein [Pseudomonadales bacterium]
MKTSLLLGYFQNLKNLGAKELVFFLFVGGTTFIITGVILNVNHYQDKFLPNTYLNNIEISGLSPPQALKVLESGNQKISPHNLEIDIDGIKVSSSSAELEAYIDYHQALNDIYINSRGETLFQRIKNITNSFTQKSTSTAQIWYNDEKIDDLISLLQKDVTIEGKNPSVRLLQSNDASSISVFEGEPGRMVNETETKNNIKKLISENPERMFENLRSMREEPVVEVETNSMSDTGEKSVLETELKLVPKIGVKFVPEKENTDLNIKNSDLNLETIKVSAVIASTSAVLSDDQIDSTIDRAKNFVGEILKLKAEDKKYELSDKDLISFVKPLEKYDENKIENLILEWSKEVNREPQDAEFDYNRETLEVKSFKPHLEGLEINVQASKKMLLSWLEDLENKNQSDSHKNKDEADSQKFSTNQDLRKELNQNSNIELNQNFDQGLSQNVNEKTKDLVLEIPLKKTSPQKSLESTNDLGIKERIGFGESYYYHSINNRVHNVSITSERISLTIVPPGEEFSFNKTLGEVSARTGYRSAYVISGGKTVLGDGGGVCQVSSTLFRAVLDAGLKVSKRLQHSYRVSYYELNSEPGFDATVYSGNIDFRFINDTNDHILIYSFVDVDNRYMNIEIFGTSDGRTTEISNYKQWDFRKPPAPEYFPTPDLPTGKTVQVDWSVSGIKTEFTHTIKDKDGNITNEEKYYSNYRPWSAKYMVGM